LSDRIEKDGNIGNPQSLIGRIQSIMRSNYNLFHHDWESWKKEIKVGVRVWPEGYDISDDPPTDVILERNAVYLILSNQIGGGLVDVNLERKNRKFAHAEIKPIGEIPIHLNVKILRPNRDKQIWVDNYMDTVDNKLLMEDVEFRRGLKEIGEDKNSKLDDRSEKIKALINDRAREFDENEDRNGGSFLDDYTVIDTYDVDPEWGIHESTFTRRGTRFILKFGLADDRILHFASSGEPRSENPSELRSPDYPHGNYRGSAEKVIESTGYEVVYI
jgi:hypothetical protein